MAAKIRSLLRRLAWWILRTVQPAEDEVDAAMRTAFAACGLSVEAYAPEFDLAHSGKLHEVLYHASVALGDPLVTVADVKDLLR